MSADAPREPFICFGLIDLAYPCGSHTVPAFGVGHRTVWHYTCLSCGAMHHVNAGSFRGKRPVPAVGAIRCGASLTTTSHATDPS